MSEPSNSTSPHHADQAPTAESALSPITPSDARWFRSIIEHSWDVIKLLSADGTILYASPAARPVLGHFPENIVGQPAANYLHPDDAPRVMAQFAHLAASPPDAPPVHLAYRCLCGNNTFRRMEGVLTNLLHDPDVSAIVLNERDVTDRYIAQHDRDELLVREQAARAQAEAASRAKDQFLSVVSHELRTPLTPVLLCVSDLQRDPALSDHAREELAMIREQVEIEAQIIDDLLDLTRISEGRLQLNPQNVDAHEILHQALAAVDRDLREKQIDLRLDLAATCNRINADPRRVRQVFWNLLSNAVKFTPAGGAVSVRTDDAPGCQFRLTVTDTGVGFRPEVALQLFRPFEQAEQSLTRRFGGLGLGLTIAKELVDLHHGSIAAASPGPDRGATFTLQLPATVGRPLPASAAQPAIPLTILLVEDNAQTRTAMARILQHAGHHVRTADTLSSALRHLEDHPIDLLVCDIGLPDGSGWELLRRASAIRTLPAIALSGFGSDQDLERSRRAGFAAHLVKPITPKKLLDAIQRATNPATRNNHLPRPANHATLP